MPFVASHTTCGRQQPSIFSQLFWPFAQRVPTVGEGTHAPPSGELSARLASAGSGPLSAAEADGAGVASAGGVTALLSAPSATLAVPPHAARAAVSEVAKATASAWRVFMVYREQQQVSRVQGIEIAGEI